MRCIVLGTGQRVTLGEYARAWRACLEAPATATFRSCLRDRWPAPRDVVLGQFREGLEERISRHLPWWEQGRNWSSDYEREMRHLADRVNGRRVVRLRDVPRRLRARLRHRISEDL